MDAIAQKPHSRHLRPGRWSESGRIYLLTTVTLQREARFADFDSACVVARAFHDGELWANSSLLAWVLMPDHWHGLVQLGDGQSLAGAMRKFKGLTSRACNVHQRREGAVWQSGYHDHALRIDEDTVDAARYIVMNPMRAGLVSKIGDYPFWNAVWL